MSLKRHLEQVERAQAIGSGVGHHDPITATFLAVTALSGGKTITAPIEAAEKRKALRRQQAGLVSEAEQLRERLRGEERRRRGRAEAVIGAGGVTGGTAQLSGLSGAFDLLEDIETLDVNLATNLAELDRRRGSAQTEAFTAGFGALVEGGTAVGLTALTAGIGGGGQRTGGRSLFPGGRTRTLGKSKLGVSLE